LQLIDIEEAFSKSLLDKLRYLQSFMCQHISYLHWVRKIVYSIWKMAFWGCYVLKCKFLLRDATFQI